MQPLNHTNVKFGYATRAVPEGEIRGLAPMGRLDGAPEVGDLVVAEVLRVGKNKTLEEHSGRTMYLFEGDLVVGSFGNRYATDQFEGYVPEGPVGECDMLSVGGVFGEVVSRHDSMAPPTRMRVLGRAVDRAGRKLNARAHGIPTRLAGSRAAGRAPGRAAVVAVVGSSMNAGKTTTAGTLCRSLSRSGFRVAAAKVTGTAAGKDARFLESCGAHPVVNFTDAGYPSTYMLGLEELLSIHHALVDRLLESRPDYVVLEVADGIFQRETRMLLDSEVFRSGLDHVFFAAGDALAVESGVRHVQELGLPLRATSGALTQSELSVREAEEATGLPCLTIDRIMGAELFGVLGGAGRPERNGKAREEDLLRTACG